MSGLDPMASVELRRIYSFLCAVEDGKITAREGTSYGNDLRAVAAMLQSIMDGDDPKSALGIGSRHEHRRLRNEARDRALACIVYDLVQSGKAASNEKAFEIIASKAIHLGFDTIKAAYSKYKEHAKAMAEMREIIELASR